MKTSAKHFGLAVGQATGQATWAKMAQKLFHLWCHSQKIRNPQPKNFFSSAI